MRPSNLDTKRFFLAYRNGKCIRQPIGINKFADFPREIAEWLKLDNPRSYKSEYSK